MKHRFLSAMLVLLAATLPLRGDDSTNDKEKSQSTAADVVGSPEQAALEFVIAAILTGDVEKAGEYIADDASRNERQYGKGELRQRLCKELSGIPRDRLTLYQIRFFRNEGIDRIRKKFPEDSYDRFGWDNFRQKLGDDLACLLVLTNKEEPILIGMVFKNVDGRYQVVHTEDN